MVVGVDDGRRDSGGRRSSCGSWVVGLAMTGKHRRRSQVGQHPKRKIQGSKVIASPELQSETLGYRSYSRFRKHQKVQSSADTPLFLPGQRRSLYPLKRSHFSVCIGLPHLHFQLPRIFNFFLMLVSRSRQSWQIRPLELPAL